MLRHVSLGILYVFKCSLRQYRNNLTFKEWGWEKNAQKDYYAHFGGVLCHGGVLRIPDCKNGFGSGRAYREIRRNFGTKKKGERKNAAQIASCVCSGTRIHHQDIRGSRFG